MNLEVQDTCQSNQRNNRKVSQWRGQLEADSEGHYHRLYLGFSAPEFQLSFIIIIFFGSLVWEACLNIHREEKETVPSGRVTPTAPIILERNGGYLDDGDGSSSLSS